MSKAVITRFTILQKAFELVYARGYQATSIDEIIISTSVTKGAFFYHFKTKDDMGLAMIREILYPGMRKRLVEPLMATKTPLKDIYKMMKAILLDTQNFQVKYGCPAINLAQEMAPVSPVFNKELNRLNLEWQQTIAGAVNVAKKSGEVRKDINPTQVANFVIAGYGGVRNLGKLTTTTECYRLFLKELMSYLNSLKP